MTQSNGIRLLCLVSATSFFLYLIFNITSNNIGTFGNSVINMVPYNQSTNTKIENQLDDLIKRTIRDLENIKLTTTSTEELRSVEGLLDFLEDVYIEGKMGRMAEIKHSKLESLVSRHNATQDKSTLIKTGDNNAKDKKELTPLPLLQFCPVARKNRYVGQVPINCSITETKIENVLTILLNFMDYGDAVILRRVVTGIESVHPGINIIIAWPITRKLRVKFNTTVSMIKFETKTKAVDVWSRLIKETNTSYLLIGRDINFFDSDAYLDIILRIMAYSPETSVVGGTVRTPNGHWKLGCEQSSLRNYTLSYKSGYYKSNNYGCTYCDHLIGPFIIKRDQIKLVARFKEENSIFTNLFLQLKRNNYSIMICADSMFHVEDSTNKTLSKTHWKELATGHQLEYVHINNHKIHFTCSEVNIKCHKSSGILLPPCCIKALSEELSFVLKSCEIHNLYCDMRAGNLLAAVKLNSNLPWELDGDGYILKDNITFMKSSVYRKYMSKYKYSVSWNPKNVDFRKSGSPWRIEIWAVPDQGRLCVESQYYRSRNMNPTRVNMDGYWVISPRNPGHHIIKEYTGEAFKHTQHNMLFGKVPMAKYTLNKFTKCPKPGDHRCLDQYKTDGNMQFKTQFPNQEV